MKYRHTFRVRAPLADVAGFHTSASSLKAITPPLIPMQLHHAPERMGNGDEMDFTMWTGPLGSSRGGCFADWLSGPAGTRSL